MKRWIDLGSRRLITIVVALLGVTILVMIGVYFGPSGTPLHSESTRPGEDVSYLKNKKELLAERHAEASAALAAFQAEKHRKEGLVAAWSIVAPGRARDEMEKDQLQTERLEREEREAKRDLEAFKLEIRARNNGQLPAWWGKE